MNNNLKKLIRVAEKKERLIIGLMSGTSLDGLDIALCSVQGHGTNTRTSVLQFITVPYEEYIREELRSVFAKETVSLRKICLLNPWFGNLQADYILKSLANWNILPGEIDLIAAHGQTIYHCPKHNSTLKNVPAATLQIGDGDHLAVRTGIITISDFRQKHLAAGGEGAPLALYGDLLLFSHSDEDRIMLNIGGIANFTYLPSGKSNQNVIVTDTGPGNTLLDAYSREYFEQAFDKDSRLALQGVAHLGLLHALLDNPFFERAMPKTTGPELFNLEYLEKAQNVSDSLHISHYDVMATLTQFSARTISDSLKKIPDEDQRRQLYVSGGGAHNPLFLDLIRQGNIHSSILPCSNLGIPGDAKEAVLFAVLANETVCGDPITFVNPGMPAVLMGKLSFPV